MKKLLKKTIMTLDYATKMLADNAELRSEKFSVESMLDLREELIMAAKWIPFIVDTNNHHGAINSPQSWGSVKKKFDANDIPVMRMKNDFDATPTFGFRGEYQGEILLEFFKKNDMKI